MPNSSANVTATLDGAPTATTIGMPATPARARMRSRDANRLEGCLPAHAARGRHVEMAAQTVRAKRNLRAQRRAHDVVFLDDSRVGAILDSHDVPLACHDPLCEQEPRSEFEIVTGGSHRDRKGGRGAITLRSRLDSDFHRLLRGEKVGLVRGALASNLPNRCASRRTRALHALTRAAGAASIRTRAL